MHLGYLHAYLVAANCRSQNFIWVWACADREFGGGFNYILPQDCTFWKEGHVFIVAEDFSAFSYRRSRLNKHCSRPQRWQWLSLQTLTLNNESGLTPQEQW